MARISRVVVPCVPHHVTQRGNRRLPTFFGDEDYRAYRELPAEGCKAAEVDILAYCLMPNHVHLVLTPASEDGLRAALADWPWSSARAHLAAKPDGVVSIGPMLTRVPDWAGFLAAGLPEADHLALRAAERTGRPLGSKAFIAEVEERSGRSFELGKAGRPRRDAAEGGIVRREA